MTIRVVVADDQVLVRSGFTMLLSGEADIEVVGEASNGVEAVALAASAHPDVMLMDVRMPVMDGLEATRRISSDPSMESTRVVILTTFDLDEYVHEALHTGASGFLLKDTMPVDLLNAVRVVADGDALIAADHTPVDRGVPPRRPEPSAANAAVAALDQLTDREREVLELVAKGQSNAEYAAGLCQPRHGQDPRQPAADEARLARPGAARDGRLRDGRRPTGRERKGPVHRG